MYINSPGGSLTAMTAIYDTMSLHPPRGAHVLPRAGRVGRRRAARRRDARGHRSVVPNSRVLIHQPSTGLLQGQASDLEIYAAEVTRMRRQLEAVLAEHTGQPLDRVHDDIERDLILTADEAVAYGIADTSSPAASPPDPKGTRMSSPNGVATLDDSVYDRLLAERIIVLGQEVDDPVATKIVAQLLLLAAEEPGQGHHAVHQFAGRIGERRNRDLRHDERDRAGRLDRGHGHGGVDGAVPAHRGRARQAVRPPARRGDDAPALRRRGRRPSPTS